MLWLMTFSYINFVDLLAVIFKVQDKIIFYIIMTVMLYY